MIRKKGVGKVLAENGKGHVQRTLLEKIGVELSVDLRMLNLLVRKQQVWALGLVGIQDGRKLAVNVDNRRLVRYNENAKKAVEDHLK